MGLAERIELDEQRNITMITTKAVKKSKTRGSCNKVNIEVAESHKSDWFKTREEVNLITKTLLYKGEYRKACLFIFGCNTGYRCGDIVSLKVSNVYKNGKIIDVLKIGEDKTGLARNVYLNDAIKESLMFLIKRLRLKEDEFLFKGDGNHTAYFVGFSKNEDGEIEGVITSGEKVDEDGNVRPYAPMLVSSVGRWIKTTSKNLDIAGHYTSHAMRKTFINHISMNWEDDNRNALVGCTAVGHANLNTTIKYYMGIDEQKLKEKWLLLNLGKEAFELFNEERGW